MLKNQISPKATAIITTIIMAAITAVYWRLLVYREPGSAPPGGGGAPGPAGPPPAIGRQDVIVESVTGSGPGYRDGAGWSAQFCGPSALAVERDGSVLVADTRNHRIRRINAAGHVSTVAGSGPAGGSGGRADGPVTQARFRFPSGVAVGKDGVIYVSDTGNHRVCRLKDGVLSTLAGGTEGKADGQGAVARFRYPGPLTVVGSDVWVSDTGNRAVRRITPDGTVTTPEQVPAPVRDALGDLTAPPNQPMHASPDGKWGAETTAFKIGRRSPAAAAEGAPHVYADVQYHVVLARLTTGENLLIAGRRDVSMTVSGSEDGPGNSASFQLPSAVAAAPGGVAYVADYEANQIRRLRLPEWLQSSEKPAAERPRGWRFNRGRGSTSAN